MGVGYLSSLLVIGFLAHLGLISYSKDGISKKNGDAVLNQKNGS